MKKIAVLAIIALTGICHAEAQTFLDRLKKPGKGKVTVTQDTTIDQLVNGNTTPTTKPEHRTDRKTPTEKSTPQEKNTNTEKKTHTDKNAPTENKTHTEKEKPVDTSSSETDTRKKVMKNTHKVTGYRVQVFTGGNTRNDRIKAENVGNAIKRKFPEQPIYVHFYSPRWICRVGNFRTYEEAHELLQEVHKMGYKQASIVRGKISVQY